MAKEQATDLEREVAARVLQGLGQLARNVVVTKADRARSAYARANSMQLSDVTREMVATLGEDHWESKFEKRPFGVRKPGAHPVGADSRTRKQRRRMLCWQERNQSRSRSRACITCRWEQAGRKDWVEVAQGCIL